MDNKIIIDVVLDTDAYNEIDDQFAISYLLMSKEKLNTKAIYAAPFLYSKSVSPKDGMEKSYDEILKLLSLIGTKKEVYKGSENYLKDEKTPVVSDASLHLSKLAGEYSPTNPNQDEKAKNLCPYHSLWTKDNKTFSVGAKWEGLDKHEQVLFEYIKCQNSTRNIV